MSNPFTRYGAFTGVAGGDIRIQIGGKGRKNVLAFTASYLRSNLAAPDVSFQGRLVVLEGQLTPVALQAGLPPIPAFVVASVFDGLKVLFDVFLSSVGPWSFYLPITQQEGSPQSDESADVNIILCAGQAAAGSYIPKLVVSGQTVFGGTFAGQTSFAGTSL
jgi:hypothetical protein